MARRTQQAVDTTLVEDEPEGTTPPPEVEEADQPETEEEAGDNGEENGEDADADADATDEGGTGEGEEATPSEASIPISGILKNTLDVTWAASGTDDAPKTRVTLAGELVFDVAEFETAAGEPLYRSGLFRHDQSDEKDAISIALKNAVNRAFVASWNEVYPPERRARAQREKLTEKNAKLQSRVDQMEALQTEMMNALLEGRMPLLANLADAGIDEARVVELGVSLAVFGLPGNDAGGPSQNGVTIARRSPAPASRG